MLTVKPTYTLTLCLCLSNYFALQCSEASIEQIFDAQSFKNSTYSFYAGGARFSLVLSLHSCEPM